MDSVNIEVVRGDTHTLVTQVLRAGVPIDLTPCQLFFTVKNRLTDADVAALFQKTLTSGITLSDQLISPGECQITIIPADTATLGLTSELPFVAVYDLQLIEPSTRVTTIMRGSFIVYPDVTRT